MLLEKREVHQLDVSVGNPCFILEDSCDDVRHIHIHRKEPTSETFAPISRSLMSFVGCKDSNAKCGEQMWQPATTYVYDEWHTVEGSMKKVCIGNPVWLHEAGIWQIDIYEEVGTPPTLTEKPDFQNFYRKKVCGHNTVSKRLMKTYEFVVERCDIRVDGESLGCDAEYVKCTG